MADWMWYTTMVWCAICALCAWYTNHCARRTQKYQSDEIFRLRLLLAKEQDHGMYLSRQWYAAIHVDPTKEGTEVTVTDEVTMHDDGTFTHNCHVSPERDWPRKFTPPPVWMGTKGKDKTDG